MDCSFDISALLHQQPPAQRQLLAEAVRRVVDQLPGDVAEIRAACAAAQPDAAGALLHRMRGSVGSLGAARFVEASLRLESILRQSNPEGVPAALDNVEHELDLTRGAAQAWLQEQRGAMAAEPCQDDLARFAQLLAQRNMDACELLVRLRKDFASRYGVPFCGQMDEHMAQLDFAAVLRLLESRTPNP